VPLKERSPQGAGNTEHLNPIDNLDISILKRFNVTERPGLELSGIFLNTFNHPQFTGGFLNDVAPIGFTGTKVHNFLTLTSPCLLSPHKSLRVIREASWLGLSSTSEMISFEEKCRGLAK